jgi:tetratricopeptide (TPR) repeat protein
VGIFDFLSGRSTRQSIFDELSPLAGKTLHSIQILDDDPIYLKQHFVFTSENNEQEDFVVMFRLLEEPVYLRTLWKKAGDNEYATLSETVWSFAISELLDIGRSQLSTWTRSHKTDTESVHPLSVDQLISAGHHRLDKQELDDAIRCYSSAIERQPKRADLYFHRAIARSNKWFNRQDQIEWQPAVDDLSKAIELDGNYGAAFFQRAGLYSERENLARAIVDYTEAIAKGYKVADGYYARACLWQKAGEAQKALKDFTAAIGAGDEFDRSLALFSRAEVHAQLENFEAALQDYTASLSINPKAAGVYLHRASILYRLGRIAEALADAESAIGLNPDSPEAFAQRGHCLSALGRKELAEQDFIKAARLRGH